MYDPKFKQLNLMVDNVLLQPEASTLFRTNWKNTNFSVWIKEIFLERFTHENPPRYLKFWHITDDIVMGVIGNLLEVSGLISKTGRNVMGMRLSPGKYKSTWEIPENLTNYRTVSRKMMVIIEGKHINNDRIKCGAFITNGQIMYNITTIIINTLNYLPAFKKNKNCLKNKNIKGFYLTQLSHNLKTNLIDKIIDSICELNEHHNELNLYRKSMKLMTKNNELNIDESVENVVDESNRETTETTDNDVDDDETSTKSSNEKKDSESKASKIWQDMLSVKNTLNCVNCFDVKKDLSEEKMETRC